jgi:hypothetical protein
MSCYTGAGRRSRPDRRGAHGAQPQDVRQPEQAELVQHARHVGLHGPQLGPGPGQVAQLIGDPAEQARRQETTTSSLSVSAAKTRPQIARRACWPPQPGIADRICPGEHLQAHDGQPGPGSSPHRPVTTCSAASHITDSNGSAHVSVTTGTPPTGNPGPPCTDAVAAVISCLRRPRRRAAASVLTQLLGFRRRCDSTHRRADVTLGGPHSRDHDDAFTDDRTGRR